MPSDDEMAGKPDRTNTTDRTDRTDGTNRTDPSGSSYPSYPSHTSCSSYFLRILSLNWLTGPIFTKEILSTSRRRRHYALRFGYLALLCLFVAIVWLDATSGLTYGDTTQMEKLPGAGRAIVATIGWFEFVAVQLVAVVLMSTSISGEIYSGTLASLLTTPITSLQIVGGKVLGKMLQLAFLVLTALPLLAIVRVFGGVPWSFVIASSCLTLTAALLAASVSLFYSVLFRRPYATILLTLATGFVIYAVVPTLITMVVAIVAMISKFSGMGGLEWGWVAFIHLNPFAAMGTATAELYSPGMGIPFLWYVSCLIQLGFSLVVLLVCVKTVRARARRAGMGQVAIQEMPAPPVLPPLVLAPAAAAPPAPGAPPDGGQSPQFADGTDGKNGTDGTDRTDRTDRANGSVSADARGSSSSSYPSYSSYASYPSYPPGPAARRPRSVGAIREITGSPVLWRELRQPMVRSLAWRIVAIVLTATLLGMGYFCLVLISVMGFGHGPFAEGSVQATFVVMYLVLAAVTASVLTATSISTEKENRTLPLLLTTTLGNWQILWAKAAGALRRTIAVWGLLALHVLVFTATGFIHPIATLHLAMISASVMIFLTGTGTYFSAKFKTTAAVVANMGLATVLWGVVPIFLAYLQQYPGGRGCYEVAIAFNPVYQACMVTIPATGYEGLLSSQIEYQWVWLGTSLPGPETCGIAATTFFMFASLVLYSGIGMVFLCLAKRNLRRNAF
ncbi:MAG: ABC transporter permease subunit [Phycisphaerae bacterium]